jgi:hypothetical protein
MSIKEPRDSEAQTAPLSDGDIWYIAAALRDAHHPIILKLEGLRARERKLVETLSSISTLVVGKETDASFNRSNLCEAISTARAAIAETETP